MGVTTLSATPARSACGTCTLCCTVMKVDMEPPKPEHQPCAHCTQAGCSIYQHRPEPCQVFECLWLGTQSRSELPTLASTLRPDRCGVVMEVNSASYIVAHCHYPQAWRRKAIRDFLTSMTKRTRVLIENSGGVALLNPDGTTRLLRFVGVDSGTNERLYRVAEQSGEAA